MAEKINKANKIIRVIKRYFKHLKEGTFCKLKKPLVKTQLNYANATRRNIK